MAIAQSKLTAQGQISIPAEIRKRLGIGPGSVVEWNEDGGKIVVCCAAKYSSQDIRAVLFPDGPPSSASNQDLKEGIERHIKERHARGRS